MMHRSVDRMLNQEAAFTASLIRSFSCGPTSWLLLPRQTGLLLRFTDEAHCSVERAVVAVGRIAGDAEADL